jgi:protein SCO1/2
MPRSKEKMTNRPRFIGLIWVTAVCLWLAAVENAFASRWGAGYVPNVPVVTQDGEVLRFYDDLIKDKIVVVSFLYTSCRDVCPLAAARLAQLQDRLGDRIGRDIFLISITIDPETDTPQRLKEYAEAFHAKPGWTFITGADEDIREIRYKLGERSRKLSEHRNEVMLGNGRTGEWQRDSALGDLERLIMTIQAMNPEWAATPMARGELPTADGASFKLTGPPGEPLFRKACAGCHTIGRGDRVGPDLAGVTERRRHEWLKKFIANPAAMRAQKDATALSLTAKFPTVRMPAMGISEDEAEDLISYIQSRSTVARTDALGPLLALLTQDGKKLSREDVANRVIAVVFGFTHCPDFCPTALLDWSNLLASLGKEADRVRLLFVTVDPERDTPEVLKTYLSSFDERIIGLTGNRSEIAAAVEAFGAFFEKIETGDGTVTFDHTSKTYLLDLRANLAGSVDASLDEGKRLQRVRALLSR